ncbi:MAG: ABC-2 family transporter protein [Pirellulales bacterium]|nr:ABC-2 family transporter protein [Pirellulales bacterium]
MNYLRVFLTFARNSLVRDMTFRANFFLDAFTSMVWVLMNLGFYTLIFQYAPSIGAGTGWEKYPFFLFLATSLFINSLVQTFFMTNMAEMSELIRTGALDFALLKPVDPQFLVSFARMEWSSIGNFFLGFLLLGYSLVQLGYVPGALEIALYPLYIACGVAIYYSLMIALAAASVWLGRNMTLLDFWFYLTTFSRYPMEIYRGPWGSPLRWAFTFIIPVLVVVNVPARLLVKPLAPQTPADWLLPLFTLLATLLSLAASRLVFNLALKSYRSASS